MNPIRVLIADDQALVRGALATLLGLENDLEVVAQVGRGDEVLEAVREHAVDVALVDIDMPGRDGLAATAEVVASGFLAETRGRRCSAEQRQRVEAVIDRMGLNDLARRPIGELSGGELQRTMLGRAIVAHPRLLVLDEPNTYMDRRFGDTLGDLLSEINREAAVVLVSHDPGALRPLIKNMAFVRRQLRYVPGNDLSAVSLDSEESESMD